MLKWLIKKRNEFSELWKRHERQTNEEPEIPKDLYELSVFMHRYYEWQRDPLWGLCDHIKSIKHMNWYMKEYSEIRGDCDDLATYTLYLMAKMGYTELYRVNMPEFKHVIGVYKNTKTFGYGGFSNRNLYQWNEPAVHSVVTKICMAEKKKEPKLKYLAEKISYDREKVDIKFSGMLIITPRISEV